MGLFGNKESREEKQARKAAKKKTGGNKFIVVEGENFLWGLEVGRKKVNDAQKLVMKARSLKKSA